MAKSVNKADIVFDEVKGDGATTAAEESSLSAFFEKNKQNLLIGVIALVVILAGVIGWKVYKTGQNTKAQSVSFQAEHYFEADSLNQALNGDGQAKGFLTISKEYSGTKIGNVAKYYIGQIYLKQGKLEDGIKYLKEFDKSNNLPSAMAYASLGAAHEDLNKFDEAAEYFMDAAGVTTEKDDQLKPFFMLRAGECYEDAKKVEKALEIYKTIKEKYPLSQEGQKIDKYIGRVSNE
jgi:predicted negative regulator of RcsB-dependent stress response